MTTGLDELSLDAARGVNTEPWPQASQRSSGAPPLTCWPRGPRGQWTCRRRAAIEDPLTTLHTRPCSTRVLAKECHRAERFGALGCR